MTNLDDNHAEQLAALKQFAEDVNAANNRYMNGDVSGVTLSTDIHAATHRLNGTHCGWLLDQNRWTLQPGDTVPGDLPSSIDDRLEAEHVLDAAPIGTCLSDFEGDRWRRTPRRHDGATWTLDSSRTGILELSAAAVNSLWLVSKAAPLTVVSVPHTQDRA